MILDYIDINNVIEDEQNGFRNDRCCEDHIYSLTLIKRNRKIGGGGYVCCTLIAEHALNRKYDPNPESFIDVKPEQKILPSMATVLLPFKS